MNKFFIYLLITIPFIAFSQESFNYDIQGLTPQYLVINFDSLNKNDLYQKTNNWIQETYKNPDEVLKSKIKNEMIRFKGGDSKMFTISTLMPTYYSGYYTIQIEFKDGRLKFEPLSMTYYQPPSTYYAGGENNISFSDGTFFYKKNGKIKNVWKLFPETIFSTLNDLKNDLKKYIESSDSKNDDW